MVEFADDLITVDEWCIGGGGLVHTSMVLKVVVCIGSDSVENVSSVRLVGLGGVGGGPVMLMSAPAIVVYGQW